MARASRVDQEPPLEGIGLVIIWPALGTYPTQQSCHAHRRYYVVPTDPSWNGGGSPEAAYLLKYLILLTAFVHLQVRTVWLGSM